MPIDSSKPQNGKAVDFMGPVEITMSSRIERGDVMDAECASRSIIQHVTSRWGVLVLLVLLQGTRRFGELRRAVGGVSERMLAKTLHVLEDDGLVLREAMQVVPPHVEYSLTPLGVEAAKRVRDLADWVELNAAEISSNS
jgi:DNA-binding HxlR family transcriptional regulator